MGKTNFVSEIMRTSIFLAMEYKNDMYELLIKIMSNSIGRQEVNPQPQ